MKEEQFLKQVESLQLKYPIKIREGRRVLESFRLARIIYFVADALLDKRTKRFRQNDFPKDYRLMTHLLAMARSRHYSSGTRKLLEQMVFAGHQALYAGASGGFRPTHFFRYELPRCVRANGALVALSALLFFGPLMIMPVIVHFFPSVAYMIVPGETLHEMATNYLDFEESSQKRTSMEDVHMWGFYIVNNVGIGLRTFAWGAICGIGSIFFMFYNGIVIGVVIGHVMNAGASDHFFAFVCTHGAPELTGIVLSGAAGMKMGFSLLAPGRLTRGRAFTAAAREAFKILAGGVALIFLAAFVEAFWSPNPHIPSAVKFVVASLFWSGLGWYFLRAGKGESVPDAA